MNKLWVRMQHQGPVREREAREKERLELRVLVGANLSQLAALDGVDLPMYRDTVLPQVLEQVVNCRDAIAQQYLMECVVQAFPTEFHIPHAADVAAAHGVVGAGCRCQGAVGSDDGPAGCGRGAGGGGGGGLVGNGRGRGRQQQRSGWRQRFRRGRDTVRAAARAFGDVASGCGEWRGDRRGEWRGGVEQRATTVGRRGGRAAAAGGAASGAAPVAFDPVDTLELYESLLRFVLGAYPSRTTYIERTLSACVALLDAAPKGLAATSAKASKVLMAVVTMPLSHFSAILTLLSLPSWPPLLSHLSYHSQKEVAAQLVGAVIAQQCRIASPSDASKLLQFVQPLMNDAPDQQVAADVAREEPIDDETAIELGPVSRLIHAFKAPSTDDQCRILNSAHKQASAGAFRRSPFTLVPVIFACLPLARQIRTRVLAGETVEVGVHKLLTFVGTIVASLTPLAPGLAMRLHLLCAQVADQCGEEGDAYEFMTGAMTTYEEDISDSKARCSRCSFAAATLHHTKHFTTDNYDTLATKTTQHSARLLKKPDQARAVCKASFLFATSACHASPPAAPEDGGEEGAVTGGGGELCSSAQDREPKRVLECLQRALKIADACKATGMHVPLFVECLDTYLLHYAASCRRSRRNTSPAFCS